MGATCFYIPVAGLQRLVNISVRGCFSAVLAGLQLIVHQSFALAEEVTIAVVDTQFVLDQAISGKAAKSNVETEIKKGQVKLNQLQSEFEKANAELQKQAAILSGGALEERKESLSKKRTAYERAAVDLREQVMRKNDSELSKVIKEIQETVSELAKENGYTFVFEKDKQTVVYASERIDITKMVIETLDKKRVAL